MGAKKKKGGKKKSKDEDKVSKFARVVLEVTIDDLP